MISFHRHLATSWAFQVGKASTHSEKIQTNTSKYLHPLAHGISVKFTIRFQKEFLQHFAPGMALLALVRDCFITQTEPFTYYLTYARELGDIKMLGQGGLKNCLP
jgi:hypothetical protein